MFKGSSTWLSIAWALLITWICLDSAPLPAQADSLGSLEPSYLVIIRYKDWNDLQRLASMDLNLLDWQAGHLAGLVTSQELAALQSLGFQVQVLDGPATFDSSYYLVTRRFDDEEPDLDGYGQVFPYTEDTVLLKAEPAQAEGLAATGFFIQKLMGPLVLPDQPPSVEIDTIPLRVQSYRPLIQDLVDSVSQTQIYSTILHLQDDDTLPGWDAQGSRYYLSGKMVSERDYIYDRLQALGLAVRYQDLSYNGTTQRNIEGALEGWGPEGEVVYIVCAHYDSISNVYPYDVAPGADDNASGTAAVLEAARVLSRYRFEHTLRFVTFAVEEQGLIGSYYYVAEASLAGTDIGGAINLDMIGWDVDDNRVMEVHAGLRSDSQALGGVFLDANSIYNISLVPEFITSNATTSSDHARFWYGGYPAILVIEDFDDFNPNYHRTIDTLDQLDMPYATKFVQATVAAIAELAEIIPPGVRVGHLGPGWIRPGETTTLTIQYGNAGSTPATGVVMTGTLSPRLIYVGDTSGLAVTQPVSGTLVWQTGDLSPYARGTFAITVSLAADAPPGVPLTSTVEITGAVPEDDPQDNHAVWTSLVPHVHHLPIVFKDGG